MDKSSAIVGNKINVGGGVDAGYRYSVPQVKVQLLAKGAYHETLVPNLEEVVKNVRQFHGGTTVKLVKKFLGQSLRVGAETNKAGLCKLRGRFSAQQINEALLKYFDLFVLCPKCMSPETSFLTDKKGSNIVVTCKACGGGLPIVEEARRHKFYATAVRTATVDRSALKGLSIKKKKIKTPRSKAGTPRNTPRGRKSKSKKLTPHDFLEEKEPSAGEYAKFCTSQTKKKEQALLLGCAGLFWDAETTKERAAVLKDRNEFFQNLILQLGKSGYALFVGVLTYLGAPKPKGLCTLFAAAVGNDIVGLEHLEAWAKKPHASVVENIGVGLPPDKDALDACVKATAVVLEFLRNQSDDESSSDESSSDD